MHDLATPILYTHFEIFRPHGTAGCCAHEDSLIDSLYRLVMAEDVPDEAEWERDRIMRTRGGDYVAVIRCSLPGTQIRPRGGDHYAQHLRTFSLGRCCAYSTSDHLGPHTRETLGSLVALALTRLKRLESFIWDMAIRIPRGVWASLGWKHLNWNVWRFTHRY